MPEQQPYPIEAAVLRARDLPDPRLGCWFCGVQSVTIAPRHTGGDLDVPAHWLPVCEIHASAWFVDIPEDERLPMIPRNGVVLTEEQGRALLATVRDDDGTNRLSVNYEVDGMDDALDALQSGLRYLAPDPCCEKFERTGFIHNFDCPAADANDSTPGAPGNDERRYDELES